MLIYLVYSERSDIVFAIRQLNKHNTNTKKVTFYSQGK